MQAYPGEGIAIGATLEISIHKPAIQKMGKGG
jgi:hypothetical protein